MGTESKFYRSRISMNPTKYLPSEHGSSYTAPMRWLCRQIAWVLLAMSALSLGFANGNDKKCSAAKTNGIGFEYKHIAHEACGGPTHATDESLS